MFRRFGRRTRFILAPPGVNPLETKIEDPKRGISWTMIFSLLFVLGLCGSSIYAVTGSKAKARAAADDITATPGQATATPTLTPTATLEGFGFPTVKPMITPLSQEQLEQFFSTAPVHITSTPRIEYRTVTQVFSVPVTVVVNHETTRIVEATRIVNQPVTVVQTQIVVSVVTAVITEIIEITSTPAPTQTPWIITATPGPTQTPWMVTATYTATITPTLTLTPTITATIAIDQTLTTLTPTPCSASEPCP